jgi:hypothetical protein
LFQDWWASNFGRFLYVPETLCELAGSTASFFGFRRLSALVSIASFSALEAEVETGLETELAAAAAEATDPAFLTSTDVLPFVSFNSEGEGASGSWVAVEAALARAAAAA